jgi:hypothetical protein
MKRCKWCIKSSNEQLKFLGKQRMLW